MLTLFFWNSLEQLNVSLRSFFVPGVSQNFDVEFWLLLKAVKVLAQADFRGNIFFYSKIYFLSSI